MDQSRRTEGDILAIFALKAGCNINRSVRVDEVNLCNGAATQTLVYRFIHVVSGKRIIDKAVFRITK